MKRLRALSAYAASMLVALGGAMHHAFTTFVGVAIGIAIGAASMLMSPFDGRTRR